MHIFFLVTAACTSLSNSTYYRCFFTLSMLLLLLLLRDYNRCHVIPKKRMLHCWLAQSITMDVVEVIWNFSLPYVKQYNSKKKE